jgi:hypothetical protein
LRFRFIAWSPIEKQATKFQSLCQAITIAMEGLSLSLQSTQRITVIEHTSDYRPQLAM